MSDREPGDTRFEQATKLLRQRILTGGLAQGARLSEPRLAKQYGVSRGPLREALRRLERERLVISVPNRGTFVVRVTPIEVLEALEIRGLLEPFAYESALGRRGAGLVAGLMQAVTKMRTQFDKGDLAALPALHGQYHGVLYQQATNQTLAHMWQRIEPVIELHVLSRVISEEAGEALVRDHEALTDKLTEGHVVTGKNAIGQHLKTAAIGLEIPHFDGDLAAFSHCNAPRRSAVI